MNNLLEETISILSENGKKLSDVVWIGCADFEIPVELFTELADKEYDNGLGSAEVAEDLIIVGDNWWLEREEYDGSEWWGFKQQPKRPEVVRKDIIAVVSNEGMWETLESMQNILMEENAED